jgi:hypothetical protein
VPGGGQARAQRVLLGTSKPVPCGSDNTGRAGLSWEKGPFFIECHPKVSGEASQGTTWCKPKVKKGSHLPWNAPSQGLI